MKTLTKTILLTFILGAFTSAFAVSEELETKLLAKAMMESATSSEQKATISKYFTKLSEDKLAQAKNLRENAVVARGGKGKTQDVKKQEMLKRAASLEKQAKSYERLAAGEGVKEFLASNN